MPTLKNVVTLLHQNAIEGESNNGGRGVQGTSDTAMGVAGISTKSAGVRGDSVDGRGVEGWSKASEGVFGVSQQGIGVYGESQGITPREQAGDSLRGGIGIYGKGSIAAGYFEGPVTVTQSITAASFVLPNGETLVAGSSRHTLAIQELQDAVRELYKLAGKAPPIFS